MAGKSKAKGGPRGGSPTGTKNKPKPKPKGKDDRKGTRGLGPSGAESALQATRSPKC